MSYDSGSITRMLDRLEKKGFLSRTRSENSDGQCLLVIIGVKLDGSKERVAIGEG